jgi:hypothetical protein
VVRGASLAVRAFAAASAVLLSRAMFRGLTLLLSAAAQAVRSASGALQGVCAAWLAGKRRALLAVKVAWPRFRRSGRRFASQVRFCVLPCWHWCSVITRSRARCIFIITQAPHLCLDARVLSQRCGFGGNNGLNDFKEILALQPECQVYPRIDRRYAIFGYLVCRYIVTSMHGLVIVSIRDAEPHALFRQLSPTSLAVRFLGGCWRSLRVRFMCPPGRHYQSWREFSPPTSIEMVVSRVNNGGVPCLRAGRRLQ